jgi:acyl dehydratase
VLRAMSHLKATEFDALEIGMTASQTRLCREDDLYIFAQSSGNLNPLHLPREDGDGDGMVEAVAPELWLGALISGVLGTLLPAPGTLCRRQSFEFLAEAFAADTQVASVTVVAKEAGRVVRLDTVVTRADGQRIVQGQADVIAPEDDRDITIDALPRLTVQRHPHFDLLLEQAEPLPPIQTAVVAAEGPNALGGALLAADHTLITPILVGCRSKILAAAQQIGRNIEGLEIIEADTHATAALLAVELVRAGRAKALMKGRIHTDVHLEAVMSRATGLRTRRRISHVFVMDVPGMAHLLLISDVVINIAPDLVTKVDTMQNAIDLAHALDWRSRRSGFCRRSRR